MNKLKCILVDDEPLARKILKSYIDQMEDLELLTELKSALELKEYLSKNSCDIVFLDINMPLLSGLDLIKNFKLDAYVIFTTAYPEHAVDAFEYDAVDYLLKPIPFERFLKAVDKVRNMRDSDTPQTSANWLLVKENKRLYQVPLNKIYYLQAYGDYVKIICADKTYLTKDKFSELLKKLNSRFQRCHRSYSVNLDHIQYLEGNQVFINDGYIPLSLSYKDELIQNMG